MLAMVSEAMQADGRAELQRIMSEALNQISAANAQAEAAARAKAELIVTKAGERGAGRIRAVGEEFSLRLREDIYTLKTEAAVLSQR